MRYLHYIWDFDGTLFDSYPHILAAMEKILAEEGLSCDRTGLWRHLLVNFGEGKRYSGLSDEAYRRFLRCQLLTGKDEIDPAIRPYDGAREVLAAIVERGGKNYLYTHRGASALGYLDRFGLTEYFADFVTEEDHFPSKPAPDAVLAILERNGLCPAECVMVGDRLIDGMAGVNAGIAGALVTAASDATKTPEDDYDAAALERELVPALAGVTRQTMAHVAANLTEFAREMGIFGGNWLK